MTVTNNTDQKLPPLPAKMRAVRCDGVGGPEVMSIHASPLPVPGVGEVLIKVVCAGVNRPDLIQREGRYPPPPDASPLLGLEVSGVVVRADAGGTWRIGDAVCALTPGGGYAEYVVAPAAHCLPLPDGIDWTAAAALPETCFTVWTNVFDRAALRPGEVFLVHGGASGIGTTAIQMAKCLGARVFATAGGPDKVKLCRQLGADEVLDYRTQDFVEEVKRLTERRGVDVILDMVGGDYTARNIACLGLNGRLVNIAFLKGSRTEVDLMPVMLKRLTLSGSTLRVRSHDDKAAIAQSLRMTVWPWLEAGRMRPVIDSVFALDEVAEAHRRMASNANLGKIVLAVADGAVASPGH